MVRNRSILRSPLEVVHPLATRGEISFVDWLPPAVTREVSKKTDRVTHDAGLPGHRSVVQLEGWPFQFEVRVVETCGRPPQIVDLRIYAPGGFGDVVITNSDLKAVPLARIAAAAGSGVLTSLHDVRAVPDRLAAPEEHTAASESGHKQSRGRGRPRKLTDEFLRRVAEYAREGRLHGYPINRYVAACIEPEPKKRARPETVRSWLAKARERQFLIPGELLGKPRSELA
ncbi:hypothetical protein [Nocardia miyunensis]|uniref:hypothetical protein n=1 Tax=Nocardia miyunensis TaxID=282684 RepID=UPI0012F4CC4F|nr:hypothetical protein [Nocardia miyunensis]